MLVCSVECRVREVFLYFAYFEWQYLPALIMSCKCANDPNSSCYVYGEYTAKHQGRYLSLLQSTAYHHIHIYCVSCTNRLRRWI